MSYTKNDIWSVNYTFFSLSQMMSFILSFCQGSSLNLISTLFWARKSNLMEVHTPSPLRTICAQHTIDLVMFCAICYHLYNFKNVKNTRGGVTCSKPKVTLFHKCFSRFLNCTSGTKSRKTSHQNLLSIRKNWKKLAAHFLGNLRSMVT